MNFHACTARNTLTVNQDLFEAVFNYFPITFKPPPDDPYGITAQQLKDRLRACIASTAEFGPHAFPALLDKLDSTSANVKVSSTSWRRRISVLTRFLARCATGYIRLCNKLRRSHRQPLLRYALGCSEI